MVRLKYLVQLFLLLFFLNGIGQTQLPSFFSDHMVLQQQSKAAIWGMDQPNTEISITGSWGASQTTSSDSNGNWKIHVKTPKAGGPYEVQIIGSETITLKNVLIGEVWICSGQSNMFMKLKGFYGTPINGGQEAILTSRNANIRLFHTKRNASLTPLNDVSGEWTETTPETASEFSAAAYFFGKRLHDVLGVPIGLIHTSWGSATAEAWMNKASLAAFEELVIPESIPENRPQVVPNLLYNAMLHPFIGYTIKGAIWYQGEGNRTRPTQYKSLFPAMIANWRNDWAQGDFPFYFVQIAPFGYGGLNAGFVREAQLHTMLTVPNTGMVVTTDIGECNDIHPKEKKMVGERLALWALAKDYKLSGFGYSGPIYRSMEKVDNKIVLQFDYAENGLSSNRKDLVGFKIAGTDQVFYDAVGKINWNGTIEVWSDLVPNPVAVRYNFESCGNGNLFNVAGLPASPFRTDTWAIKD